MDDLIEETRKLSNTLNVWDFSTILKLFTRFSDKDPIQRRHFVLEEYFNRFNTTHINSYQHNADIVQSMFPEFDKDYILNLFRIVGNEDNCVRIITKLLLNKVSKARKRTLTSNVIPEVSQKKMKITEEEDNIPQTSSFDSESTIICTPVDMSIPHESVSPIVRLNEPSSIDQPSTSCSAAIPLDPFIPINDVGNDHSNVDGNNTNLEEEIIEYSPPRTVLGEFEAVDLPTVVEIVKDSPRSKKFNLYKHLQEMFTYVPLKTIRRMCKRMNLNKRIEPPNDVMNGLIIRLLTRNSSTETPTKTNEPAAVVSSSTASSLTLPTSSSSTSIPVLSEDTSDSDLPTPTNQEDHSLIILNDEEEDGYMASPEQLVTLNSILDQLHEDKIEEQVKNSGIEDNPLIYPLMEMFPQACPRYIRQICRGKEHNTGVLDGLISQILATDYPLRIQSSSPPRKLDAAEQLQIMKSILVDADPDYLQMHCDRLIDKPEELKEFIAQAVETHNYPTLKDFLRKQQISAQQKQYTTEFDVEKFVELIPNPFEYFNSSDRNPANLDYLSQHYVLCYLRNKFLTINLRTIRDAFIKHNNEFLPTCTELELLPSHKHMKSKRSKSSMPEIIQNILLLQEIAFYDHKAEILKFLNKKKLGEEVEWRLAKASGTMQTCSCCFDDEVMPKNIYTCDNGCVFCKDCVRKGAEIVFGDGKLNFPCLANCASNFSLQVLQAVLTPKMFSIIALKKQVEEVKAAGIEDLETCPFCDFATIPVRDDKLFRCLNPECMKESCRTCKEPSHVPLRCEEVEKDSDVQARTYIENKMTEALLRTCYKCGMKFIKSDGCNKMTCSCGALMCYVCGEPVKDYKHFNGIGGDNFNLCPLYSDTNKLHRDAVLKGAKDAKQEVGAQLKIDPASDIQNHYAVVPAVEVRPINPFVALAPQEAFLQRRALERYGQLRAMHMDRPRYLDDLFVYLQDRRNH